MIISYLANILSIALICSSTCSPIEDSYKIVMPLHLDLSQNGSFDVAIGECNIDEKDTIKINFSDDFVLCDEYGKSDVYGSVTNSEICFSNSDYSTKTVAYNIEGISAGKWNGNLSVSISLNRETNSNLLKNGEAINAILSSLNPSTISFSHDTIGGEPLYDLSLEDDGSILLYKNNDEVIITNMINEKMRANEDMSSAFFELNVKNINNLDYVDMSNCKNMSRMFQECGAIETIDVSSFDTHNVTNMSKMFDAAHGLKTLIGLENFDVSNVTTFSYFLNDTYQLTSIPNLSNWNITNKCTNLSYMLAGIGYQRGVLNSSVWPENVNYSKWDVSNVTNMSHLFTNAFGIKTLNIDGWDTGLNKNMSSMFEMTDNIEESKLETVVGIEKLNVENVTNMSNMFKGCELLNSDNDFSSWNPKKVTNLKGAFYGTKALNLRNFENWKTKLTNIDSINKTDCFGGQAGCNYDSSYVFTW